MKASKTWMIGVIVASLSACGGGGGGGSTSSPAAPVVSPPVSGGDSPAPTPEPVDTIVDQEVVTTLDTPYWRQVSLETLYPSFRSNSYWYKNVPDVDNCDPGEVTDAAQEKAIESVNQIRSLHGLSPLVANSPRRFAAQESSLLQLANEYLSHFPSTSDQCYTADAALAANEANLFGSNVPANVYPPSIAIAMLDDRTNIGDKSAVGHRRLLLANYVDAVVTGHTFGYATQLFQRIDERFVIALNGFTAVPYRDYPYLLARVASENFDKNLPWSYESANIASFASVSVVRDSDGAALEVTEVSEAQGQGNGGKLITWEVPDFEYDVSYTVTISGQFENGASELTYPVRIVYADIFDFDAPNEAGDIKSGSQMAQGRISSLDRDSFEFDLQGDVTITKQASEFGGGGGYFLRVYETESKKLILEYDAESQATLTGLSGSYTFVPTLCRNGTISSCYEGSRNYSFSIR